MPASPPSQPTLFPAAVRDAMAMSGSCVTCLPIRMDEGEWETAIFFAVAGGESEADLRQLAALRTVPLALDTDIIRHQNAAVAVIRMEILLREDDPLVGEMLLLTGGNTQHFETLELLTRQPRLGCFIGDQSYRTVLSQYLRLGESEHQAFKSLLDDVVQHDAVVRMTGRYDAGAAFAEVTSNYAHRHEVPKQ